MRTKLEKDERFFSTGDISRLLDGLISRSTVTRLFDQGKLAGRVNPITGRRDIEWQVVIEWLKEQGVSPDNLVHVEKRRNEGWTPLKRKNKMMV